jgi:predicted transcriptional regulator
MVAQPSFLLREARRRMGLSQRALALRAGTAQSVVARIEAGTTSPSWSTLERLLQALGFEIQADLAVQPSGDTHMLDDVARILGLAPEQRLVELRNFDRFLKAARRVP